MRTLLYVLLSKVRAMFAGGREDREAEEELQTHLSLATEENIGRGMPPEEARRAAHLAMGGMGRLRDELHENRGIPFVERVLQDLRYGWRTLLKNRGFTAAAVATLALGIGANTVIFSLINILYLKPLPYPEPERLVNVWRSEVKDPESRNITSSPNFHDWERLNHVFEHMALFDSAGKGYNLSGGPEPERVPGLRVSASLFPLLGVPAYLGRTFTRDEETLGKHRVVVLSYGLWKRRYGGDRSITRSTVRIDGQAYAVVGVMPPGFEFDFFSGRNELWVPAGFDGGDKDRSSNSFGACARLKKGVTLEQARSEMDIIGRRLSNEFPDTNGGETIAVTPMSELGVRDLRSTFIALSALVGFVLLIACVNVANLMLARGTAREKEIALRRALGAGRRRIIQQLITESLLLSLVGATGGVAVAAGCARLAERMLPEYVRVPFRHLDRIELDASVFAFALLLCGITGVLFGLVAAYGVLRRDAANDSLKSGQGKGVSSRGGQLRYVLVAAEVSLALTVLVGAGLMLASMARLLGVDPGLNPKNVLVFGVSLPQKVMYYSPPEKLEFCLELTDRVGSIPGVLTVGAISHLPIGGGNAGRGFVIQGQPDPGRDDQPGAAYGLACPDFFKTLGIPVASGREFNHRDTVTSPPVVVINQALAKKYWRGADPLGGRIRIGWNKPENPNPWMTIVGVIRDIRHSGLDTESSPHFYRPYTQAGWPVMSVVVKTASQPHGFLPAIKQALLTIDPDRAASGVRTMEEVVDRSMGSRRLPAILLISFGVLSLVLAAVGISGVVAYSVAQKTKEIGIRVALGATTSDVLHLVLNRSMIWASAGIVVGMGASYAVTRLLTGMLYGVEPMDPKVVGSAALILASVALAASYVPARRAAKVDPIVALRCD